MQIRESLNGGSFVESFTLGRCWRLFVKPWAWPYARHAFGVWTVGAGPLGVMVFDRQEARNGVS